MSTFSSTNIIKKNITTKPFLITREELDQIGNEINLVAYDFLKSLPTPIDGNVELKYGNPSSPRILNYVEEYTIAGINYTLFYTEVNTGLNIGDKVFIINGAYDSNLLIKKDKYKKGRDGYKVLFVDGCKIVLDIEFVGYLPSSEYSTNQDKFDDFIKVYYVKDENDFLHVNRQITTRGGLVKPKFNPYNNNIIFTDKSSFPIISEQNEWGNCLGLNSGPGFYIKNGTFSWTPISSDFMSGSYSIAAINSNSKILIQNGGFTYNNFTFNEYAAYTWEYDVLTATYSWTLNVKHENNNPPIITKSNFRNGDFGGVWNGGLYGTSEKRIKWDNPNSTWNSGTLLNTIWTEGIMNSYYSQKESYYAEYDAYLRPYQKINNPDNNGYGFNFVINSDIQNAVINNGNVSNSILGSSASQIVEEYIKTGQVDLTNFNATSSIVVNKALFDNCKFINANIENTEIRNSRAENSRFNKVKSINSHYKSSLFLNSNYISDNTTKVLDYDELTYNSNNTFNGLYTHIVYKFYINKRSYDKFKFKDSFYIKGIKINNNSGELINFFDKKFKIGPWKEYTDLESNNNFIKSGEKYSAFLSTPADNEYTYSVNGTYNFILGEKGGYSVDIFVTNGPRFNIQGTPNTLDFSEAYIHNSDFESGLFENSNWNNGNHINFNSDTNITKDINLGGGQYNLTVVTQSNTLIATLNSSNTETEIDYLTEGSIVFLNSVDYDTRGKVTNVTIINPGNNSIPVGVTNSINLTSSGSGLILGFTSSLIGSVKEVSIPGTIISSSGQYSANSPYNNLKFDITVDNVGNITSIVPVPGFIGSGYTVGTSLDILTSPIITVNITKVTNGEIIDLSIINEGLGYEINKTITIGNGTEIEITGVTGTLERLPDSYKILTNNNNNIIEIEPINPGSNLSNLLDNGIFSTYNAYNRYGYLHKTKFVRSRIISGIFKNSYITESLIKNESYDVSDKDFSNISKLKSLIITDNIFSNNKNILSKATYMNSSFVGGNDIWENGILYESIWNGMNFSDGLVKESIWIDGIFKNGLFYNSRSFDNATFSNYNENVKTRYYKSGTGSNARFSWENGTFLNGEFYKSDWENGEFNGGKFYYSKFYNGNFNDGLIGDKSISMDNTWIYNGVINYAIVENSKIISKKYNGISNSVITWENGIFNSGVFGTDDTQNVINTATWSNGIFNGGEFTTTAKWLDGIFNEGKFISYYGWQDSNSTIAASYSWENGIFNGGEFGNANTGTNSTWFDGEFNDGKFKGRVWNSGVFLFGDFIGSGTNAIGGIPYSPTQSNPNLFIDPFITSDKYYGLWRNGYVTDIKDAYLTEKKLYTDLKRSNDTTKIFKKAVLTNILWQTGTFSHPSGEINNSVWLDGNFNNGRFNKSSFNPYSTRTKNTPMMFNFSDNCHWNNGIFDGGEFNISNWENGLFVSGTATGMIWNNGIVEYMNAYNIFWENGLWKNGNWNGSYFNLDKDGKITEPYIKDILFRGMSFSGTQSCHVWNIFYDESLTDVSVQQITGNEFGAWIPDVSTPDTPPTPPATFSLVTTPTINATNDSLSINSGNTTTSVLSNDTLNGNIFSESDVILTGISVPSGFTLNPDGTITVSSLTPAGTYTLNYKICDLLNPTICDSADAIIVVTDDVSIGTQTWQLRNLNVSTYRDGTPIPQVTNNIDWANLTTGAWCYYDNDPANEPIYGKLYNWYAVNNTLNGGLAPTGYHIPTDTELTTLINFLGGQSVAGGKLKETGTTHWQTPNPATNTSGFTALPGGFRQIIGTDVSIELGGFFWTSTESLSNPTTDAESMFLVYNTTVVDQNVVYKKNGLSVRCIKD